MAKASKIICRVSVAMKEKLTREAKSREEAEAVIIREALTEYFEIRQKKTDGSAAGAIVISPTEPPRWNDKPSRPAPRQTKSITYLKTKPRK